MTRRIAIAALVGALVLPLAPTAHAPAAALAKFAGATTVAGTTTASTLVRLDRAVQVPVDELHEHVEVTGRGRAYGVVVAGAERRTRDAFLSVIHFSFCGPSCTSARDGAGYGFFNHNNDVDSPLIELPAGLYQVVLIADGAKVVTKLSLPGLRGSTAIKPTSRSSGPASEKVVVSADDSKAIYAGGSTFRVQDRVFSASALRVKRDVSTGGIYGACFYEEGVPSAGAFAPGCPGGTNNLFVDAVVGPFPMDYVFASALVFTEQGEAGQGNWFTSGSPIKDADAVTLQVPLRPVR